MKRFIHHLLLGILISIAFLRPCHAENTATPTDTPVSVFVISAADARALFDSGDPMLFVDVREPNEYANGHIEDATNMPWFSGVLEANHEHLPDIPLVVYCASGFRSGLAATFLVENGHTDVYDLSTAYSSYVNLETRTPTSTPTENPTATPTPNVDLNGDGMIDEKDLMLFIKSWNK